MLLLRAAGKIKGDSALAGSPASGRCVGVGAGELVEPFLAVQSFPSQHSLILFLLLGRGRQRRRAGGQLQTNQARSVRRNLSLLS